MSDVEKVARAIYEARGAHEPPRAWRKWEDIGDEARAVWCQCATAALAVMEREATGANSAQVGAGTSLQNAQRSEEPVAWADIASAPKDGTWVMLKGGEMDISWDGDTTPPAVVGQWVEDDMLAQKRWQFAWFDAGFYGEYRNPTHWMPLP